MQACCTGTGIHHEQSLPQVKYNKHDLTETKEERKQRKYRYLYQVKQNELGRTPSFLYKHGSFITNNQELRKEGYLFHKKDQKTCFNFKVLKTRTTIFLFQNIYW